MDLETADQTERIFDLLEEFTERLRTTLEKRDALRFRMLVGGFVLLLILVLLALLSVEVFPDEWNGVIAPILSVAAVGAGSFVLAALTGTYVRGLRSMRYETQFVAVKLLKVVRYASQMVDHNHFPIDQRLEFELRIADADAVLHRAKDAAGIDIDDRDLEASVSSSAYRSA